MTDGQPPAATSCDDGTECGADVRNVTFIHGDSADAEDDDDDDVHVNGEVPAVEDEEEEADVVPELPTDVEIEELTPPLTPDGGWGWMVVVATFVSNLIVDGVAYTFGIIMPELIQYFNASKGKTALVGSMVSGVYLIVGNSFVELHEHLRICRCRFRLKQMCALITFINYSSTEINCVGTR